jgi:hypothetical protein
MKQSRLVSFLQDLFTDVKASGKTSMDYFELREENKIQFKETEIYKEYLESIEGGEEVVDQLFKQMESDASDGMAHLYLPNQNGDFTKHQTTLFYRLADTLTAKTGVELKPLPPVKTITKQTEKKLTEAGNLTMVKPLALNGKTQLIEGEVINPNDPEKQVLTVKINPNKPEEIAFENSDGTDAFKVENSDSGLGIFIGAKTRDIALLIGVAVSNPSQETLDQAPDQAPAQNPVSPDPQMVLPVGLEEEETESESELPSFSVQDKPTDTNNSKDIFLIPQGQSLESGISTTKPTTKQTRKRIPYKQYEQSGGGVGRLRLPTGYTAESSSKEQNPQQQQSQQQQRPLGRHTKENLKKEEQANQRKKAGVEEDGQKKTTPQNKSGSVLKKLVGYGVGGGALFGGGITMFSIIM